MLRHAAPDAVDYCIALFKDENAPPELRAKVAMAIWDKAIPDQRVKQIGLDDSVGSITIHIQRAQQPANAAPTIDAEREKATALSFRTVCAGSGDD